MLRIRAHHFLCMQGFQGSGYNEEFAENMRSVIFKINSGAAPEAEVVSRCDVFCDACPHNEDGYCRKIRGAAKTMDRTVLKKLDMKEGTKMRVGDVLHLVNTKLKSVSDVLGVCGPCEWQEKCLWFKGLS
ncbi:MAG: DUF1284 domain-containing protein [bacterium]